MSSFSAQTFILTLLQCKLLLIIHCLSSSALAGENQTDYEALLAIKSKFSPDPYGILKSWNDSLHFCQWNGITCGRRHMRVTVINLRSIHLIGSISPYIGNLSFLREIRLSNNTLHGQIPPEIGRLFRLELLSLSNNSLVGQIPTNLSRCTNLMSLGFGNNSLDGKIPEELGDLLNLQTLYIYRSHFQGEIPRSIGNLSSLEILSASWNDFEGSIPDTIGLLKSLTNLELGGNKLSGIAPQSLYNLSSVRIFSLGANYRIRGNLPSNLGLLLPQLRIFEVGDNQFSGPIPLSLSNATQLRKFTLADNNFSGKIPHTYGSLQHLTELAFDGNNLGGGGANDMNFLPYLVNCGNLEYLGVNFNSLQGSLPPEVANLSTLMYDIGVNQNRLSGTIPSGIENLVNLEVLELSGNQFTGAIPGSLGQLQRLRILSMDSNKLSGEIPSSLGNLSWLSNFYLYDNRLQGNIPQTLENCKNLLHLDVSENNLNGSIPAEIFNIPSLSIALNLSHNLFTGSVSSAGANLKMLGTLDLSYNELNGEIPGSFGSYNSLEELFLQHNFFQGHVPSSFSFLKGIQVLDLSHNNLTGPIPDYLERLPLLYLNLSFNNFEGEVPRGIFKNTSVVSVAENSRLCGGIPELLLPRCPIKKIHKLSPLRLAVIIIACIFLGLAILTFFVFCWLKKKRRDKNSETSLKEPYHQEPIIHCDLKPSNILLDNERIAHVGDFGLARILLREVANPNESSSIGVKGTIGYAAPEYGLGGEVSREGDVYSYGILLLEMMTGKRPTNNMFENELNLHEFAMKSLSDHNVIKIVDRRIVRDDDNWRRLSENVGGIEVCISSMVQIGVACSMDSPMDRIEMRMVVQKLFKVRDAFETSQAMPCQS
ncbi:Leucine-rich receptor-like protein kinase family protein [Euphorbia peplus]|nr:Leucine-rich receptor-like protein kinase family protein [Euphorbia peplus]